MLDEIHLDKIRRAIMVSLNPLAVNVQLQLDARIESATMLILYELCCTHQRPYVVRYPKTWWQMLKHTHAPEWFKRKWPVKLKEIKVDVELLYPYLKSQVPRELMGEKITLLVRSEDHDYFQSFDPDTPEPVPILHRRVREQQSICDPKAEKCPMCDRQLPSLKFQR